MNIYLVYIEMRGWFGAEFYELVKAENKQEAYEKVWKQYPKAKEVEIDEPIE